MNPLDTKIHAGAAEHARHPLPAILGIDMAGTVEALGAGVTRFRPGDEVFGMTGGVGGHQGSLAEYAAVDADLLALKPSHLSMREASVIPLGFITAWEGLVDRMAVHAGQAVLVLGGAGGVGRMAVQIARARGAEVSATGSVSDRAAIEQLGARFIDRSEPVAAFVARTDPADAALTWPSTRWAARCWTTPSRRCAGSAMWPARSAGARTPWRRCRSAPEATRASFTLLPLLTGEGRAHHGEILAEATRLAEAGQLTPLLSPRRFTLETVGDAYRAITEGTAKGKMAIDIGREMGR